MEIRVESRNQQTIDVPQVIIDQFQHDTIIQAGLWAHELQNNPDQLADLEQQIDRHYRQGAGYLTAAVLAQITEHPQMEQHVQEIRNNAALPLRSPQPRTLKVRLLCGLVLWITTAYCAPRRNKNTDPSEQLVGLYPELAALGLGKGCSPALQYKVARLVALSPSIEAAHKELRREGIQLDKKAVRRIAEQLGQQLLELRRRELFAWRDGWLLAGNEFAGRRVAVQIDGGRVRLRENKPRKKNQSRTKGSRPKFETPWREPKVLIIFEFNEQGKMIKKEHQPLIDGTLLGPDHLAELVAFHLHRLGVARAESVVFISDGAFGMDRKACGIGSIEDGACVGLLSCGASHQSGVVAPGLFVGNAAEALRRTAKVAAQQPLRRTGAKADRARERATAWGRPRGVDGDTLFGASRLGGPFALCDVSSSWTSQRQWCDRKHDPSRDQPASKEQRDLLAGGERGRRVCLARVASLRSLGDDANAAARCDGA